MPTPFSETLPVLSPSGSAVSYRFIISRSQSRSAFVKEKGRRVGEKREKGRENFQSAFLEERDIINMLYLIPSALRIDK